MGLDVSVCMPAHRDSAAFRRALQSVLGQDHRDIEVIVSDDSGGDLEPCVREADDARIRYFANPRPLGFARNHTTTLDRAREPTSPSCTTTTTGYPATLPMPDGDLTPTRPSEWCAAPTGWIGARRGCSR